MRLVTYRDAGGFQRAGALLEKDQLVLDLQVASETIHGHARPEFASVLALVEAGEGALDAVRALVQRTPARAVLARADVLGRTDYAAYLRRVVAEQGATQGLI